MAKFPLKCFGDGSWVPNFDWFIRPETALKIAEGAYDWSKNGDDIAEHNRKAFADADRILAERAERAQAKRMNQPF